MRKVGFIGAYDKTDLLLYIAKMLSSVGKKVLVVDATVLQKTNYLVPNISPTLSYVTTFEEFDIAVGFHSMEDISDYLGKQNLDYDFVLMDIDSENQVKSFELDSAMKNYFVTSFDTYSIRRGLEVLSRVTTTMQLTKIILTKEILREEDEYLNFLAQDYPLKWGKNIIYFPLEMGDQTAIMENQRVGKIRFKNLTTQYRDSLMYIVQDMAEDITETIIRRTLKVLERGA